MTIAKTGRIVMKVVVVVIGVGLMILKLGRRMLSGDNDDVKEDYGVLNITASFYNNKTKNIPNHVSLRLLGRHHLLPEADVLHGRDDVHLTPPGPSWKSTKLLRTNLRE